MKIELAIAFVINRPGVTSAIIGPRTNAQLESRLPSAAVTVDSLALDRIDEIVKPSVNLNPLDTSYGEQLLAPSSTNALIELMTIERSAVTTPKEAQPQRSSVAPIPRRPRQEIFIGSAQSRRRPAQHS